MLEQQLPATATEGIPNALLFYLGQQHQAIAPCVVYEFDFHRRGNKSYRPTMIID
jgi:hypothetical protein